MNTATTSGELDLRHLRGSLMLSKVIDLFSRELYLSRASTMRLSTPRSASAVRNLVNLHHELTLRFVSSCADPRCVPLAAILSERGSLRSTCAASLPCKFLPAVGYALFYHLQVRCSVGPFFSPCRSSCHLPPTDFPRFNTVSRSDCPSRLTCSSSSFAVLMTLHEPRHGARPRADPRVFLRTFLHVLRVVYWSLLRALRVEVVGSRARLRPSFSFTSPSCSVPFSLRA